jgi:ribosomal protein S18 acetylase RimI-like enzyme
LAVHPENQGRGVATELIQSGLKQAKCLGLDVFIEASRSGLELYKRLGFHVEKEHVLDDSKYGGNGKHLVCFMVFEQISAD